MHFPSDTTTPLKLDVSFKAGWLVFAALELWMWFDMAGIDYQQGSLFSFWTAGWFLLGQVFAIPFFGFAAWMISLLFKRWPRLMRVLASLGLGTLLGTAIHGALPRQQLSRLIGAHLVQHGKIERMKVSDTFNDGNQSEGILVIGSDFVKALREDPAFELVNYHVDDRSYVRQPGRIYQSKRAKLRITPDEAQCFFESRSMAPAAATRNP